MSLEEKWSINGAGWRSEVLCVWMCVCVVSGQRCCAAWWVSRRGWSPCCWICWTAAVRCSSGRWPASSGTWPGTLQTKATWVRGRQWEMTLHQKSIFMLHIISRNKHKTPWLAFLLAAKIMVSALVSRLPADGLEKTPSSEVVVNMCGALNHLVTCSSLAARDIAYFNGLPKLMGIKTSHDNR